MQYVTLHLNVLFRVVILILIEELVDISEAWRENLVDFGRDQENSGGYQLVVIVVEVETIEDESVKDGSRKKYSASIQSKVFLSAIEPLNHFCSNFATLQFFMVPG